VAVDSDGGLWAAQAKAYAPFYAIKKAGRGLVSQAAREFSAEIPAARSSRSGC
jgi:hypothetical protein